MRKYHVRFNHEKLRTELIPYSTVDYIKWILLRLLLISLLSLISILSFDRYFEGPKVKGLKREVNFLELQIDMVSKRVTLISESLGELTDRDKLIYRNIFGSEPYPESLQNYENGVINRYQDLKGYNNSEQVIELRKEINNLERRIISQDNSFRKLIKLSENREELLESIPAIQPVRNSDLKRVASGYGYRIHPIYKVRKMHWGMDFSAPTGTEIFATGNGKVIDVKQKYNGYGYYVHIQHGFGYETLYAHMSKILVKQGQIVKRGEVIGLVGSTGTSVAPHLHYEVLKDGEKVNPVHYYFNDLTPQQYEQILVTSERANQSFD